jgi:hypothetical protein
MALLNKTKETSVSFVNLVLSMWLNQLQTYTALSVLPAISFDVAPHICTSLFSMHILEYLVSF